MILRALRCDSPAKGASERSEAAPERELAQESKALSQQRSRIQREAGHEAKSMHYDAQQRLQKLPSPHCKLTFAQYRIIIRK